MSSAISRSGQQHLRLDRLHDAMAARVSRGELPGLVTLVAQGDEVRVDAIGTKEVGGTEPMRRDTLFRITSMTKPVLAVAVLMLVEEGRLGLAEPIDRLLPELAGRRVLRSVDAPLDDTVPADRPTTVEDLLTFRMGHGLITEPSFNPPYPIIRAAEDLRLVMAQPDPRTPLDPDEWIAQFGSLPLMDQPGTRWRYNAGALVLSVLVARAAGRSLPDFCRERIFEPLGMPDTGFHTTPERAADLPVHYMTDAGSGKLAAQTTSEPSMWAAPPIFPSGAAGLVGTVDDYLAFARLLVNKGVHRGDRLLSERSVTAMTTNHLTPEQLGSAGMLLGGRGWGYLMSVHVTPDDASPVPGRYGWEGGYGTVWCNDPHRGRIAIGLSQTTDFLFGGGAAEFVTLACTA